MSNRNYLEFSDFDFRQKSVAQEFAKLDYILEVGSFDRKLRESFDQQFTGKIVSCDPLIPETIEFENGDIQFSGTLVECLKFLDDKEIKLDGVVALGLNLVPLDSDPEGQFSEYFRLIEVVSNAKLFAIEYPVKFFPAKIESEMALSLVLPTMIVDKTLSLGNPKIPFHANVRRLVIGTATKKPQVDSVRSLFRDFRINSYSPSVLHANWLRTKLIKPIKFGNSYFNSKINLIFTKGEKWSYVLNLGNVESQGIALKFYGFTSGLTLSSASEDSQEIHFEKRIQGNGKLNILSFSEASDTALIRFGNSSGVRFFIFKAYCA
jgi:hypothetical protein